MLVHFATTVPDSELYRPSSRHGYQLRTSSTAFHTSKPPSPPTATIPLFQSTLSTFFLPSQALNVAIALFWLRKSHRRTIPSYAPLTIWCAVVPGAMHDGVAECRRDPEDIVVERDDSRTSYMVIVRSVEAARAVLPSAAKAMSRNGFSDAV